MAVTTATYTATATWTASQLAGIFRSAFIDAGLMTEWHDSFLNTVENRVMEVTYDGAKTYGKTYYWFQFTTGGVFFNLSTGWTAGSDIPSGTQYLDYYATTTNATTNHSQLVALSSTTTTTIDRFTSGDYSWFLLKNGTTFLTFHVVPPSASRQSWIDLDKVFLNGFNTADCSVAANKGYVDFRQPHGLRRMLGSSGGLRGSTTVGQYQTANYQQVVTRYVGLGNASAGGGNNIDVPLFGLPLPYAFTNTNTAYASNYTPVFSAPTYNHWLTSALPSDFGVAIHYADNTMAPLDTFTVSAGSEVWTILARANNATITSGGSPLFLARTT
jgi:hypothetical protein